MVMSVTHHRQNPLECSSEESFVAFGSFSAGRICGLSITKSEMVEVRQETGGKRGIVARRWRSYC
jgi:hypothetical protein